jgi:hydroxycarboxylate dehydrogenase B
VLIPVETLRGAVIRILRASGSSEREAAVVTDHLIEANLRGHDSHGVGMLPTYLKNLRNGSLKPNEPGRIVKDDGAFIVYDGLRGFGQVVAKTATELGIRKAQASGLAVVALRNAHHIGRIGSYGEQCAEAGLVSLHFVNVMGHRPLVAPYRGLDARGSTDPVSIAIPAAEPGRPMILDMATSKIAMGKVRVARNKGETLAPELIIDSKGQPSRDPRDMFAEPSGALLPMAEHKGYALAFACELLAGAIAGSGTVKPENQGHDTITNGMLVFIIDPKRMTDGDWIAREIRDYTAYVTASPVHNPAEPVLIPGDPERQRRAERLREGIPVDAGTCAEIVEAAAPLKIDLPEFAA